jgi:hypothetical protein
MLETPKALNTTILQFYLLLVSAYPSLCKALLAVQLLPYGQGGTAVIAVSLPIGLLSATASPSCFSEGGVAGPIEGEEQNPPPKDRG